jgi:hypothetical protein
MKKFALAAIGLALVGGFLSAGLAAQKTMYFTGEIMDSECAGAGSHEQMISTRNMKDAKTCTLGCVKNGSVFVLYDTDTKTVFQLDNQKKPRSFAGTKVMVTGVLENDNKTIHVKGIDPAPTGRHYSDW